MRLGGRARMQIVAAMVLIAAVGTASALYVLLHERLPVPFQGSYNVRAVFSAADGITPGIGQPVTVSGVQVGTVTAIAPQAGNAALTLQIERRKLSRVYDNAQATLEPITPLQDMQVDLAPGAPPARPLPAGGTIQIAQTSSPIPLSTLLSSLDGDTRSYLSSLIASLGRGTAGRGPDLRRMLAALGPTSEQIGQVSAALASRRRELAQLVHDLSQVTLAAARDQRVPQLIAAGSRTLEALARPDRQLRSAVEELPGTLAATSSTLTDVQAFDTSLRPALNALTPAVSKLPQALDTLTPFASTTAGVLARSVRPLVREAQRPVTDLAPALTRLNSLAPDLIQIGKVADYAVNELAYNPGHGDPGYLFWLDWWFHNYNSLFSAEDAHGGAARAMVMVDCEQLAGVAGLGELYKLVLGVYDLCPQH